MTLPTNEERLAKLEADAIPPDPIADCPIFAGTQLKHRPQPSYSNICSLGRAPLYRERTLNLSGVVQTRSGAPDFRIGRQPSAAQVGLVTFGDSDAPNDMLAVLNNYIVHGHLQPDYFARTYVAFDQAFINHKLAALLWVRPSQAAYGNPCSHEWRLVSESLNRTIRRLDQRTLTALPLFAALDSDARTALGHQFPDHGVLVGTPDNRGSFQGDMFDLICAIVRFAQVVYQIEAQQGDFGDQQDNDHAQS